MYQQGNIVFTPDGNSVLSPVGNRISVFDLVKSVLLPGLELRPKSTHASFSQQQVLHLCFPKPQKYCCHRTQSPWEHFDQCRRRCVQGFVKLSIRSTHTPRRYRRESPPRQLPPGRCHSSLQFQKASQRHRIFAQWIIHRCDARIACPSLEDTEPPCSRVCAVQSASNVYRTS